MGSSRALIVGSDKDYCYVIKEFLDSRGMISSLILDYNQGIDKLFYENPDVTVIELISSHKVSSNLIGKVKNSSELNIIDFTNDGNVQSEDELKPVFLLEETSQLNTLLAFLNTFFLSNSGSEQTSNSTNNTTSPAGSPPANKDLESFPYPILLSYLHRNTLSGILTISSNVNLKLYFVDGVAVYAEGGDVETALGRMLIESGRIGDVKDYEKALNIATEKKQKLGEVLVSMGVLSPHELNELLENQIEEKVIRGFLLKSGVFNFESGKEKTSGIVTYDIDFPKVLYQGAKRYADRQFIKNIFFDGSNAKKIKVIKDLGQKTGGLGLGPKELRVIQNLEKNTDIENLLDKTPTSNDETLKILFLIYLLGYVVIDGDKQRNIGKLFNKSDDDNQDLSFEEDYEEIIDLDEEISEAPKAQSTDTETKKELSDKDKEMIKAASKLELEMEIDSPTVSKHSNVIPFKEQSKNEEKQSEININIEEPRLEEPKLDENEKDDSELVSDINKLFERLDEEDHYMILGVDRDSTKERIRDRYHALVKRYHPDILAKLDASTKEKADKIFSVITTAYQILNDDDKRNEYDSASELDDLKSEAQVLYQAEVSFNEGAALLKQKKYALAEEKFESAIKINPDNVLYKGIIYWGRFLNNKEDNVNVDECVKELEKLVSQDALVAENYYYLGSIYKHVDNLKKAETYFSKAVENDPDYTDAKRELRLLQNRVTEKRESRKGKTEKRFWSSLFKK